MKKIKVLSLFNGMNCIGLALHNLGIEFELYASEIDKYATKVSDTLFPNTVNLGDVTKIDLEKLPVFDLVVGGSPCQGFSFAGKQLNFEDERSKLFFDFVLFDGRPQSFEERPVFFRHSLKLFNAVIHLSSRQTVRDFQRSLRRSVHEAVQFSLFDLFFLIQFNKVVNDL